MKVNCTYCNKELWKAPSEIRKSKSGRSFCDSSCAASFNNKMYPKRILENKCPDCDSPISSGKIRCRKCSSLLRTPITTETTLAFFLSRRNDGSRYSRVRDNAKLLMKHLPQVCSNCGYDKHVHTCHIKGISNFPITATLGEVNRPSNLILLCPNCHWELDNGLLKLDAEGIEPSQSEL